MKLPKKIKKVTYKQAKAKAWKAFSEYIRRKDADANGFVKCYTCNNRAFWKEMQAGHGIGGRSNAVFFLEAIVKPQCKGCNIFKRGNYTVFTKNLIKEIGLDEYEEIEAVAKEIVKYTISDLLELERWYSSQIK